MDRRTRQQIAAHYKNRMRRGYVKGKLASDPAYAAVLALVRGTSLPLLDIGCGLGLLGQYLNASGHARPYLGLDHDRRKIVAGQHAVQHAGLGALMSLQTADAMALPPLRGHVALLDVLHYMPHEQQVALLHAAVQHLGPDGCLIIRNVLRERNWRFHATRLEEFFLHATGWMARGPQHYPSAGELRRPLEDAGLVVQVSPMRGRTPFNSYLIVARQHR